MACRSKQRAEAARAQLFRELDRELQRRTDRELAEYGQAFREGLEIEFVSVDLTSVASIFAFCNTVSSRHVHSSRVL